MVSQQIDAIIFDCDGTLVDSESLSIAILVDLIAEFGLTIPYEEALQAFSGNDLKVVFHGIEEQLGHSLPDDFLERFRLRQMDVLQEEVNPIDGAHDLLDAMTRPFCVASNAPLSKVNVCLQTTGLHRFFEAERIFSAYQIQVWKPAPDLFLMAAESLGFAPERCAVVEDSSFGIDAGLAAGMHVIAYDPEGERTADDRVTSVQSLTELQPLLCR